MSRPKHYRCHHCGQRTGIRGHLRVAAWPDTEAICPAAPRVRVVVDATSGDLMPFGYCCPDGHTCLTGRHQTGWRMERPSERQLAYLYSLGYRGHTPITKGEASDLLQSIIDTETKPRPTETEIHRAIRIRD